MILALAITGPTASGKTALSIAVAKELGCEIISSDSMQIYKGMDIGTAKATIDEREGIAHHLLDIVSPLCAYSAENYREDALACASSIAERGKIPLFVGGTGLYIDTVMRPCALQSPPSDPALKEKILLAVKTEDDIDALYRRLVEVDPVSAEKIHKNNVRRVARALEIYELTGKTKSYFDEQSRLASGDISVVMVTLDFHERANLYARTDMRVDEMLESGLFDEVKSLYDSGLLKDGTTAYQAIGYKELVDVIEGRLTLNEASELIKLSTRRYAKRQLTWFRHEDDAIRIYVDEEDGKMKSKEKLIGEVLTAFYDKINSEKDKENEGK